MLQLDSSFSGKALVALTGLVLLAHLLVLGATATTLKLNVGLHPIAPTRAFSTRSVEFFPAQPASTQSPTTAARAAARKNPTAAPAAVETQGLVPTDTSSRPDESALLPTTLPATDGSVPEKSGLDPNQPGHVEQAPKDDQLALAPAHPPRNPAPVLNAERFPRSVRLNYEVATNKFPYRLSAELVWQLSGQNYQARLAVGAFGQTRVQTSRGQTNAQGLVPIRFSDKYRSEVAAHFNYQSGKVTFSANTPDVSLLSGAQDRLSIMIELATMFASTPGQYPPATTIAIQTIGPRDADTWLFTVGEKETLSLPGGELATVKLLRNARQEFDQKVELWLAPALDYLPARVRITESNGDYIDQKWLSSEPAT